MFSLREYIKEGFIKAVGKMADYQIILNSVGWYEKGVLTQEDLDEINQAIENQYKVINEIVEDIENENIDQEDTTNEVEAKNVGNN